MTVRRMKPSELPELLRLYAFLHPGDPVVAPTDATARRIWDEINATPSLRYYVVEADARLVATCTLALIPNLTRGPKPYGVIENVVTDPECRNRGFATAVLHHALNEAWAAGCYKVMLSTGSKREETLRFYEHAGFQRGVKTGFVAYPTPSQSKYNAGTRSIDSGRAGLVRRNPGHMRSRRWTLTRIPGGDLTSDDDGRAGYWARPARAADAIACVVAGSFGPITIGFAWYDPHDRLFTVPLGAVFTMILFYGVYLMLRGGRFEFRIDDKSVGWGWNSTRARRTVLQLQDIAAVRFIYNDAWFLEFTTGANKTIRLHRHFDTEHAEQVYRALRRRGVRVDGWSA